MNRRDLLKHTVAAGAAAAAPGCVSPQRPWSAAPDTPVDEILAKLDADLACIDTADLGTHLRDHLGPAANDPRLYDALRSQDPLVRKAAKTLYLTATFRDLPEASRAHPAIQERMRQAGPMMSEAVLGMRDRLAALTGAEKKELQQHLRSNPDLAGAVCRSLDQKVSQARLQPERRIRQRRVMNEYAWRMERQSVAAVIDPQLEKANRALTGYAARQRKEPVLFGDDQPSGDDRPSGETVGLSLMGIGLVTGGVSALLLFTPASPVGAIGTTVGGALLVIGLLVFFISAIFKTAPSEHPATGAPDAPQPLPPPSPVPAL
ncbi:MAG TPA: twin-arginine translocation signal domain-containing protein [Myxococcaceae bacterium]|jgi:hypothetical protein